MIAASVNFANIRDLGVEFPVREFSVVGFEADSTQFPVSPEDGVVNLAGRISVEVYPDFHELVLAFMAWHSSQKLTSVEGTYRSPKSSQTLF